jgi:pre-rRNA-processing protein IPI1
MLLNSNIEHHGGDEGAGTLSALVDHGLQVSSAAATKRLTVDFFVRLILVRSLSSPLTLCHHLFGSPQLETDPRHIGTFRVCADAGCLQKIGQWVLHLPKTLWELGDTDIPCTEVVHAFHTY